MFRRFPRWCPWGVSRRPQTGAYGLVASDSPVPSGYTWMLALARRWCSLRTRRRQACVSGDSARGGAQRRKRRGCGDSRHSVRQWAFVRASTNTASTAHRAVPFAPHRGSRRVAAWQHARRILRLGDAVPGRAAGAGRPRAASVGMQSHPLRPRRSMSRRARCSTLRPRPTPSPDPSMARHPRCRLITT
jgi:hypothetical protein